MKPLTFFYLWLGFSGVVFRVLAADEAVIIQLPEKAAVVGPQVTLGEVAEIVTRNKAMLERARRLILGRAAPAGSSLQMSQAYVKIVLRKAGYDLKDFSIEGADTTAVLTQSQELPVSNLLPEIKDFVLKGLEELPENLEVKLAGGERKLLLPGGKVQAHFRPPFSGKYEGSLFLTCELEVDGHLVKVLPLRVNVEVFHTVAVTTKRVEKGDKFTIANVALARKPTSALLSGAINHLEEVIGRTAAMPIAPGTVLRMKELYDPPVIQHGQIVEAVVRRGNVEIAVQARAIEDGKAGDFIRLENTDSRKLLRGKVLNEKQVLIEENAVK